MKYGEYYSDEAVRERQRARIATMRLNELKMQASGLKGSPGFLGLFTFGSSDQRQPGYIGNKRS